MRVRQESAHFGTKSHGIPEDTITLLTKASLRYQ